MNLLAGALGALIAQVDSFIRKDLFSVLLPGFVLVLEIWIILGQPPPPGFLDNSLISAAVIVYLSYVIGFLARQVSFFVAEGGVPKSIRYFIQIDRAKARKLWEAIRHTFRRREVVDQSQHPTTSKDPAIPYGTSRWGEAFYSRDAFHHNYKLLTKTFGREKVDEALLKHPFASWLREVEPAKADFHEVFHYCKLWLRINAADLSTESMEIEFNLQLSIVPPVIFMPFALKSLTGSAQLLWIGLGFAMLCTVVMYNRGNHLRHAEAFNVLRNVAIAQWCADTRLGNSDAVTQIETSSQIEAASDL